MSGLAGESPIAVIFGRRSVCVPDPCLLPGELNAVRQGTGNRIYPLAPYVFPFLVKHNSAQIFHQIPTPLSCVWCSVPRLACWTVGQFDFGRMPLSHDFIDVYSTWEPVTHLGRGQA